MGTFVSWVFRLAVWAVALLGLGLGLACYQTYQCGLWSVPVWALGVLACLVNYDRGWRAGWRAWPSRN